MHDIRVIRIRARYQGHQNKSHKQLFYVKSWRQKKHWHGTHPPPTRYGKEKQNSFKVDGIFFWIEVHLLLVITMEIWWNSAIDSRVLHFFSLPEFKSFVHINVGSSSSLQGVSLWSLLGFLCSFSRLFGFLFALPQDKNLLSLITLLFFHSGMAFCLFLFTIFDRSSEMLNLQN